MSDIGRQTNESIWYVVQELLCAEDHIHEVIMKYYKEMINNGNYSKNKIINELLHLVAVTRVMRQKIVESIIGHYDKEIFENLWCVTKHMLMAYKCGLEALEKLSKNSIKEDSPERQLYIKLLPVIDNIGKLRKMLLHIAGGGVGGEEEEEEEEQH